MGLKIFQMDAFTDKAFGGNPAAVCVLPGPSDEAWMQNVAREMNLSKTAFLYRQDNDFNLRWFTPTTEVNLCGHATLASAHILQETGDLNPNEEARFHTRSGLLTADRMGDRIKLGFPGEPIEPTSAPPDLGRALGVTPTFVGKGRMNYLVEVASEETVRGIKPDFTLLTRFPNAGFTVTSQADSKEFDFVFRYFAPSAHCCLGRYWKTRLHKDEFVAYQASESGGTVRVRVGGDRVHIGGQATTVMRAELV